MLMILIELLSHLYPLALVYLDAKKREVLCQIIAQVSPIKKIPLATNGLTDEAIQAHKSMEYLQRNKGSSMLMLEPWIILLRGA